MTSGGGRLGRTAGTKKAPGYARRGRPRGGERTTTGAGPSPVASATPRPAQTAKSAIRSGGFPAGFRQLERHSPAGGDLRPPDQGRFPLYEAENERGARYCTTIVSTIVSAAIGG